eukprot:scaffold1915_cov288-Prasinococcus_capsulatus_cf.AAC.3
MRPARSLKTLVTCCLQTALTRTPLGSGIQCPRTQARNLAALISRAAIAARAAALGGRPRRCRPRGSCAPTR